MGILVLIVVVLGRVSRRWFMQAGPLGRSDGAWSSEWFRALAARARPACDSAFRLTQQTLDPSSIEE